MHLSEYQLRARQTSRLHALGTQGFMAQILGLAGETGAVLDVHKRFVRQLVSFEVARDQLRQELGDVLWYLSAVASSCDLSLDDIVAYNLKRVLSRYPVDDTAVLEPLPQFDSAYPLTERFPRKLVVHFTEQVNAHGQPAARMLLLCAEPNAFPNGACIQASGKRRGYTVGEQLGDPLTDNTRRVNGYRYHDAIHFGFMAVLGWSPTMRALLQIKRKSDPATDEAEDGARAIFAEEGLAAALSRLARRRLWFQRESNVDGDSLDLVWATTEDLEVNTLPAWLWCQAISQGFQALRALERHRGGYLVADLDERALRYKEAWHE